MIKLDNVVITPSRFPDGTHALRVEPYSFEDSRLIEWMYESDEEMITLFYLTKHLKSFGNKVSLSMPYIPNARMDRVKHNDEIFTLKYFAEFINSLGFERVMVVDPHSNVSCALINNILVCDVFHNLFKVNNIISDNDIVYYYPDEGAMKRYSEIIPGVPYSFGIKHRDWRSGEITGLELVNKELVMDKTVLIVDDICSKGTTFYYSAKALKEAGAKNIYLYITHCENTILEGEVLKCGLIDKVFTTNSIFTKSHEKIEVI